MVAERRSMKQHLKQREGAQPAEWLEGIDDLSRGSFDMLTLTVYYPA
jgi:hypothetical protein